MPELKRRPLMQRDRREYRVMLCDLFKEAAEDNPSISLSRSICAGAPCIKGTRIPVWCVLRALSTDKSFANVRRSYPVLSDTQISDALWFAKTVLECAIDD